MKSAPACIPCVLGQVLRFAREVAEDDWLHRKVLEEAMGTLDDRKREALIQKAAELAMGDTALIPIHYEVSTWATAAGYRYAARPDQYTLATGLRPGR